MTHSGALYRPSLLELAQGGNFRAIGYWMSSLLAPYNIAIRTTSRQPGQLNIQIQFRQRLPRDRHLKLRQQLVRLICYRLWTLNSAAIQQVCIVARQAGDADILWKQSVRIVTPASRGQVRRSPVRKGLLTHPWRRSWFQLLRSALVTRLAVAGFLLSYWLLYWDFAQPHQPPMTAAEPSAIVQPQTVPAPNAALTGQSRLPSSGLQMDGFQNAIGLARQEIEQQETSQQALASFRGQIVYQGAKTDEKLVAITFDDGPWDGTTQQVLEILRQYQIKATFFWIGIQIQRFPDLARQVVSEGHAIGNHTWRHPLHNLDEMTAAAEVGNTARLIQEVTGVEPTLMRPPGGNLKGQLVPYAQKQQQIVTLWSVESRDYAVSAPLIVHNVLSQVYPGAIVLMHDGGGNRSATVQALPQIIEGLQKSGYRFVTVPELLAAQAKSQKTAQNSSLSGETTSHRALSQ